MVEVIRLVILMTTEVIPMILRDIVTSFPMMMDMEVLMMDMAVLMMEVVVAVDQVVNVKDHRFQQKEEGLFFFY